MYTKSTSVGEDKLVYMEEHTYITTYTYMYVGHLGNGNTTKHVNTFVEQQADCIPSKL